ncbi:Alanine--tRNA ligase [Talaromyces islandicus]|uniref:Alanine--tRNA ligase n=1 Tax=Talaromyces islandicus TaxID=28573 RepID=A0A0U1M6F2_TALIS|nr:Alanine--tRNA ligase [Talaromyces islandicus]
MPKVASHTPPWLCRPSPGASFFTGKPSAAVDKQAARRVAYEGPQKTLAQRGTEVFAVVDNQIRWTNLVTIKAESSSKPESQDNETGKGAKPKKEFYRTLTVPVYGEIKQLVISPNGVFMAVVTAHTVHIAILPDSSHLSSSETIPLRLKTYQLGPTTHVIPESPVISALWHPLGTHTNVEACIVTVTADAAVRVWELDRNNHWSFDRPTLAIDLTKLVDGTSSDEDFTPLGFGKNKGFSADAFDMEVASATFGGTAQEGEDAWAPMTLWVAMRPGDLYALCPLLPSKWQAPPATIPALSAAIIPKLAAAEEEFAGLEDAEDELVACRQQYEWLKEIDDQGSLDTPQTDEFSDMEIFKRPVNPSAIPRLQGPFQFDAGDQIDDLNLTDLTVIPAKLDTEALMTGEDDEDMFQNGEEGLSVTIICLSTSSGRVHVCLELDGVEGQWLPKAKANTFSTPLSEPSDLVLVESLDTVREQLREQHCWPTFTRDIHSRYGFYLTTSNNVSFISLSSWAQRLEAELQSDDAPGSQFRLNVLCDGSIALRELIIQLNEDDFSLDEEPGHLSSSVVFSDYDFGTLLLTYRGFTPQAAVLDEPQNQALQSFSESVISHLNGPVSHPPIFSKPQRAPYQVPAIFYTDEPLGTFIEDNVPHRHRGALRETVRLSPSTLDTVAAAHRVLAAHTGVLEKAAADLFRRCERLRGDMRDQLEGIAIVAERIKNISSHIGADGSRQEGSRSEEALSDRLAAAKQKQADLVSRYSRIRTKLSKVGGRPLSEKENAWVAEVDNMSASIIQTDGDSETLGRRLEMAKSLADSLLAEVKRISAEQPASETTAVFSLSPRSQPKIPPKLQRAKVADAMKMIDRESAVIDAITAKLERLNSGF